MIKSVACNALKVYFMEAGNFRLNISGKDGAMRTLRPWGLFFLIIAVAVVFLVGGCGPDAKDLRIQNDTQRKRIADLESEMQAAKLKLDQANRELDTYRSKGGVEVAAMSQKVTALEEELAKKKALIASMQQRLLAGGAALPVELTTMLEDFAKDKDIVSYDSAKGVVKFKSDLTFESGSDKVSPAAAEAIKSLSTILNSDAAKEFDVIIAGHTDDVRITKSATREKHPTNWHLSAHRAISVLDIMTKDGIAPERISVRGFGEYRPLEANKPNKKGNPQNRRVEIYIVPKGV